MQLLAGIDDLPRTGNVRTQLMALWVTAVSLVILLIAYAASPRFLATDVPADVRRLGRRLLPEQHRHESGSAL